MIIWPGCPDGSRSMAVITTEFRAGLIPYTKNRKILTELSVLKSEKKYCDNFYDIVYLLF